MRQRALHVCIALVAMLVGNLGLTTATVARATPLANASTILRLQPVDPLVSGVDVIVLATLNDTFGRALANQPIEFYVDDVHKGRNLTDANGVAAHQLKGDLSPGRHTLKARFGGSQPLDSSDTSTELMILKSADTNLSIQPVRPLAKGEKAALTAQLTDGQLNPISDAPVDLFVDGTRERRVSTDMNGKLTFPIADNLAPGAHQFKLAYSGSTRYTPVSSSVQVFVKPPAPVNLTIQPIASLKTGERPTVVARLSNVQDQPLTDQLLDIYLDGTRLRRLWTDPNGSVIVRFESTLLPGTHTVKMVFDGAATLTRTSAGAEFEIKPPLKTALTVQTFEPMTLGESATINLKLMDEAGEPVSDQPVEIYVDEARQRRVWTDQFGIASLRFQKDLSAGTHAFKAVFDGGIGLAPTSITQNLVMRAARIEVHTVPPLQSVHFTLDGRTFTSGADGIAYIDVDKVGTYHLEVSGWDSLSPDLRAEFQRWGDEIFEPARDIRVTSTISYEVAFDVSHRVSQTFIDLAGKPVDSKRVTSIMLKGSQGTTFTFEDGQPRWLQASRVVRRQHGLEVTRLLYSVQAVIVEGENVVNQAQQRFYVNPNDQWPIQLLLYNVRLNTRDALFGFPVGNSIQIDYPGKRSEDAPLNPDGRVTFRNLARGPYRFTAKGAWGIAPTTPVDVSKDQDVPLLVITYWDIGLVVGLVLLVGFGLLFIGRPQLLTVFHPRTVLQTLQAWRVRVQSTMHESSGPT